MFLGLIAQLVEQHTFNVRVPGSIPGELISPHRLARSRTPPFHGENRGSNPLGDVSSVNRLLAHWRAGGRFGVN